MGLFNFKKKKEKTGNMKPATEFYTDCLEAYHQIAKENGYANKGVILIPELMPFGSKAVLA